MVKDDGGIATGAGQGNLGPRFELFAGLAILFQRSYLHERMLGMKEPEPFPLLFQIYPHMLYWQAFFIPRCTIFYAPRS